MTLQPLGIAGAFLLELERIEDDRGFFARTFCAREFAAAGVPTAFVQSSVSFNARRGTVRGLHFQWPPSSEGKLVRCIRGAIFDALLDLRPQSSTYLSHVAVELTAENRRAVFIPHGVAHGFETLQDATEIQYQMTDWYAPELASGYRWNDPAFGIDWPLKEALVISRRDAEYADFDRLAYEREFAQREGSGS